ncbi:MAG TPA: PIG-L deacetylase family protein [Euzebyales bacterium]|nr:PIG-L deacetylase family protein [Euzebyales bacterium]
MIDWSAQRVLVLSPHPDDEVIGCGGLLSKVKDEGGQVFVQFVTLGDTRDVSVTGMSTADERVREIERVAGVLKYDEWDIALRGSQYHLRLDAMAQVDLIAMLEIDARLSLRAVEPTVVLLPSPLSYNQDHRAVAEAALTALRPLRVEDRRAPQLVALFEEVADQWTPHTSVPPNLFVELEPAHLDAKIEAMACYASQVRAHPHTRSLEALRTMATVRGAHSGLAYAEAYQCMRLIG